MMPPLSKSFKVAGISSTKSGKKLSSLLRQVCGAENLGAANEHIVTRMRLSIGDSNVTLSTYTSDKVLLQASQRLDQESLDRVVEQVKVLTTESTVHVSDREVHRVIRSRQLSEYMDGLGAGDVDNLVAVLLADLILDLVATERLADYVPEKDIPGFEGLPHKVRVLSEKIGGMKTAEPTFVYRYREMLDLRQIRNRIAHGVQPITRDEVDWAKTLASDILNVL